MPDYQGRLDEIERAVDEGRTDLKALSFWGLLSEAKRDPGAAAHAERIGRIDRKVFEARRKVLLPVWVGNVVLLVGTIVLLGAVAVALRLAEGTLAGEANPTLAGAILLVAALGLSVSVHAPAHWVAGRVAGMRFTHYFLGGPFRIQPGVKADYESYLLTPAARRATMHAAGALASKLAPFAVFGWAYVYHWQRGWDLLPPWSLWALLGLGLFQILTDVVWSTRRSDWRKVRRELRIAREVEDRGEPADGGVG